MLRLDGIRCLFARLLTNNGAGKGKNVSASERRKIRRANEQSASQAEGPDYGPILSKKDQTRGVLLSKTRKAKGRVFLLLAPVYKLLFLYLDVEPEGRNLFLIPIHL